MDRDDIKGYKKENYIHPTSWWSKTSKRKSWYSPVELIVILIPVMAIMFYWMLAGITIYPPQEPSVLQELLNPFWLLNKVVLTLIAVPILYMGSCKLSDYSKKQNWMRSYPKAGIWVAEVDDEGYVVSEIRVTEGELVAIYNKALREDQT